MPIQLGTSASLGVSVALSSTMFSSSNLLVLMVETMNGLNPHLWWHSLCMSFPTNPPYSFWVFMALALVSVIENHAPGSKAKQLLKIIHLYFSVGAMFLSSTGKRLNNLLCLKESRVFGILYNTKTWLFF